MTKDFIIITAGRIFQIILALVAVKLMTSILSEKEVGNYYLITAIIAFFNLVLLNPPGMYFGRHLLHWQQTKNILNAVVTFLTVIVIISVIAVITSYAAYHILDYKNNFQLSYFLFLIFLALIISTLHRNVLSGINILGFRKRFVLLSCITLLLGLVISVLLILSLHKHALIWLSGIVCAESITLFIIINMIGKGNNINCSYIKKRIDKHHLNKIMGYCIPIGITTFLLWGQTYSYRFIVESKYSIEMLAFIGIGLSVSSAIFSAVESISMQYFNPIFLKEIMNTTKEQRSVAWNNIANKVVPIYVVIAVFVIMLSPALVKMLVGAKFFNAYCYTMVGAGIEFFRVMTNLLNLVSQSELKTKFTIKPYLLGTTFTISALFLIDIGEYFVAIPMILLVGYAVIFGFMFLNMRKLLEIKYNLRGGLFALVLASPFLLMKIFWQQCDSIYLAMLFLFIFGSYLLAVILFLSRRASNANT